MNAKLGVPDWRDGRRCVTWHPVEVLGDGPMWVRIRANTEMTLASGRYIAPGKTALVPRHDVRFE